MELRDHETTTNQTKLVAGFWMVSNGTNVDRFGALEDYKLHSGNEHQTKSVVHT